MQYTMNAAWVVSDSYIASSLFPYFLCRSLIPFLNPKFFKTLVIIINILQQSFSFALYFMNPQCLQVAIVYFTHYCHNEISVVSLICTVYSL